METTPVSLLQRLQRPDAADAWPRFVDLYLPLLLHWARRLEANEADAADLVQDVFLTLLRTLPEFRYAQGGSFRAWLKTILVNRQRDLRRQRLSQRQRDQAAARSEAIEPDALSLLEDRAYQTMVLRRVLEMLQPEFQSATWKAFQEHSLRNRPAAEVAAELGLTRNAVYLATSRVLRRLRTELDGLLD